MSASGIQPAPLDATAATSADLRVESGTCQIFFAYDIGFAIDLDAAERLITSQKHRAAIRHKRRAPSSFQYHPPPLRIAQSGSPVQLDLGNDASSASGMRTNDSVEVVVYDFGAALVAYSVPLRGPMSGLRALSNALYGNAALQADSRRHVEQALGAIRPAVTHPAVASLFEDYVVFHIESVESPADLSWLVTERRLLLAQILRSEVGALSEQEIADALSCRISYGDNDMTLIDWNSAIIFDRDAEDVRMILEHANVELLEVRMLDGQLDDALSRSYEALTRRRWRVGGRSYRSDLARVARWQADSAIVFEGVNNALKLLGDQYLARVYRAASQRFYLADWDASILRKLSTLESIYTKMSDHQATRRMETLEWIVVILIAIEIVLALWQGH